MDVAMAIEQGGDDLLQTHAELISAPSLELLVLMSCDFTK
jgi:hypothetical protein